MNVLAVVVGFLVAGLVMVAIAYAIAWASVSFLTARLNRAIARDAREILRTVDRTIETLGQTIEIQRELDELRGFVDYTAWQKLERSLAEAHQARRKWAPKITSTPDTSPEDTP